MNFVGRVVTSLAVVLIIDAVMAYGQDRKPVAVKIGEKLQKKFDETGKVARSN